MPDASAALQAEIVAEIEAHGPLPFARFMEMALYHPRHGYYSRGLGGGGGRDYVTSSSLHRLFGALIARQAAEMWRLAGSSDPFLFVEFGPGEGIFAGDFLASAAADHEFSRALRYRLIEPSAALRARQQARLSGRGRPAVAWWSQEDFEAQAPFIGCLFANEVLDAFPVHRVVGTADGPREVHVAACRGGLEEILRPSSDPAVLRFLEEAGIQLQEGQEVDLNLEAPRFLATALGRLERGYALVVDYGDEANLLYHPMRRSGTIRAYHRHRVHDRTLERPGDQDLTAHVDFTAVTRAAEKAGARALGRVTQGRFLMALGALDHCGDSEGPGTPAGPEGAPARIERVRQREALKELILPGRMGDRFHVLIFGMGGVSSRLTGLGEPWARAALGGTDRCQ